MVNVNRRPKDLNEVHQAGGPDAVRTAKANAKSVTVIKSGMGSSNEGQRMITRSAPEYVETEPPAKATLLGDHWLFRGGWAALIGPTGQGKTSLTTQMGICWALGKSAFGIRPNGALKVMMVQVENDERDLHEIISGVFQELQVSDEEREVLRENTLFCTPTKPGQEPFGPKGEVTQEMDRWQPDLLCLDSLYKWLEKGTAADPEGVVKFLDRLLLPLCKRLACGLLASHHMGRQEVQRLEKNEDTSMTNLYAGAGGMFIADNARATLLLAPEAPGQYRLRAVKRGSRIGWCDENGHPAYEKHLRWASGHIGWKEVSGSQANSVQDQRTREKRQRQLDRDAEHVLWALDQCSTAGEWILRSRVAVAAEGTKGPIPEGMCDRKLRLVVDRMIGTSIEKITRRNESNRDAVFIRRLE